MLVGSILADGTRGSERLRWIVSLNGMLLLGLLFATVFPAVLVLPGFFFVVRILFVVGKPYFVR